MDDEKWKLSKKGRSRSGRAHMPDGDGSAATVLSRSYSASVSSSRGGGGGGGGGGGQQQAQQQQAGHGLSKKCVEAVKEHRARFYIVRRCVSMLVCWRDH